MKTKHIPYGETRDGHVISYEETVPRGSGHVLVFAGDDGEAYVLLDGGKITPTPNEGDLGTIRFERGGPHGGHWKYRRSEETP